MQEQNDGIESPFVSPFRLVRDSDNLANRRPILRKLDNQIGYIRARNFEAKARQVPFLYPVFSSVRLIGEFRWPHHRPIERSVREDSFHRRGIGNRSWKEQPTKEIGGRENGILEEERDRFDNDSSDPGGWHRCG